MRAAPAAEEAPWMPLLAVHAALGAAEGRVAGDESVVGRAYALS